ncbi:NAD(P)H-dependent oxidoreductase [Patescibacteria group bacterium]|nr:NAD(P)H-dependent oxidoreductase [Patescibacteria group bacterium]MDE1946874.1 NAD(P)H-dependent oxidoreductase [Patescibacteria group bacterium]MDE2010694.1 NAD(P)H-dependent oxidoreductase [Patescibacteria group bacterium]MDE2232700.1 NAD(P)H-dependent oxidoreductase [Patescibacteria group bacterium]
MANKNKEILKIAIIIGSTRPGRFGDKPAKWIYEEAKRTDGVEAELLDLRDYPMPFYAEDHSFSMNPAVSDQTAEKWQAKIGAADAFVIVTPEYNHGPSAVLKNALDYAYREWNDKPVAFVAYGSVGGARAVEQLRLVAIELQMAPIRNAVHIPAPWFLVDGKGDLKPNALDPFKDAAKNMLEQLVRWGRVMKR